MRSGDLTDLAAFVVVAEHLSFRAAADKLGVTPSALSHRLRQLRVRPGLELSADRDERGFPRASPVRNSTDRCRCGSGFGWSRKDGSRGKTVQAGRENWPADGGTHSRFRFGRALGYLLRRHLGCARGPSKRRSSMVELRTLEICGSGKLG